MERETMRRHLPSLQFVGTLTALLLMLAAGFVYVSVVWT